MNARRRLFLFALSLAVACAGYVERGKADPILSDRLLITNFNTGAVLFDQSSPEGAEVSLIFQGPFNFSASTAVVVLTEPPVSRLERTRSSCRGPMP